MVYCRSSIPGKPLGEEAQVQVLPGRMLGQAVDVVFRRWRGSKSSVGRWPAQASSAVSAGGESNGPWQ
ncbi:MAG: hypothetical protein IPL11_19125 [Candidatus Accumulibacter sp.]|nr:hypothetical protein [Accumulibacter sp.]